jgi:hypothetical protein
MIQNLILFNEFSQLGEFFLSENKKKKENFHDFEVFLATIRKESEIIHV